MFFSFSACQFAPRRRGSSEIAILPFCNAVASETEDVAVIDAKPSVQHPGQGYSVRRDTNDHWPRVDDDIQHREAQQSLRETLDHLQNECPHGTLDMEETRKRINTDLSEFSDMVVNAESAPSGSGAVTSSGVSSVPTHDGFASHDDLTEALYEAHGVDLASTQRKAKEFLQSMGLRSHDSGARNTDGAGQTLWNQCFYLSMTRAFLGHKASSQQASELALRLKRAVEAAVLAQHPSWADGISASTAGEGQAMVFADFLPIAMAQPDTQCEPNLAARLAVCILDSVGGHVEVYLGPSHAKLKDRDAQVQHLVLLWYVPGHYMCIVKDDEVGSKVPLTYAEFKELLSQRGVVYLETLG